MTTKRENDYDAATVDGKFDVDKFNELREQRVAAQRERVIKLRDEHPPRVHKFVVDTMISLVDLMVYHSDSTLDEYSNAIDEVVDVDQREAMLSCGYDNDLFADPTSAEYRTFASECDAAEAIRKHLTETEIEILNDVADVWSLADADYGDDDNGFDDALARMFDAAMTRIDGTP